MTAVLLLLLGCLLIFVIILANGYFVAQEFAYMSVDRHRLRALADSGDRAAQRALRVTGRTSFMLSGAQLGITVTGLLVGYVAEPLVGEGLGELLGGVGVPDALSITAGTVLALAVSTVVQMIFGELFPKNYAIANPTPLALGLSRSTTWYLAGFGWFIALFDRSSELLLKLVGMRPVEDVDSSATAEDLERIVADSRASGHLPEQMYLAFDRILDFPDQDVEHAMIPRSRTGYVAPGTTVGEVRTMMAAEHTRYPVIDADDQPIGIVTMLDVLAGGVDDAEPVTTVMREPVILPTLMRLPEAVRTLREQRSQLACVIDEYGGFVGVVTLEDLGEEIFGDITDEHDAEPPPLAEATGEDRWRVDGEIALDELERAVGHDVPEGDYETLSGLLIDQHGGLPDVGDRVLIDLPAEPGDYSADEPPPHRRLEVTVVSLERHVPSVVELSVHEDRNAEQEQDR